MNGTAILFPIILGLFTVLQGGLNRRIIPTLGLGGAAILNATILTIVAYILVFSHALPFQPRWNEFKIWYLLPGLLGLGLVTGIPFAIARWGAAPTFLWVIASQIVCSVFWDTVMEGQELSIKRLAGGGIALLGSWIATR